jgi:hypothetical protein
VGVFEEESSLQATTSAAIAIRPSDAFGSMRFCPILGKNALSYHWGQSDAMFFFWEQAGDE